MKQPAAIVVQAGRDIMRAYQLAAPEHQVQVAGLMWDCLRVAALLEGQPVDDFHQALIAQLETGQQIELALGGNGK